MCQRLPFLLPRQPGGAAGSRCALLLVVSDVEEDRDIASNALGPGSETLDVVAERLTPYADASREPRLGPLLVPQPLSHSR